MNIFILFQVLFGLSIFSTREISGKSLELPQSYKKEDLDRFESGYEWGSDPEEGPYSEGDMIKTPQLGNGVTDKNRLWPMGIVYYQIVGAFDSNETSCIQKAIKHIQDNCCIQFRKRRTMNRDYVTISKTNDGCSAAVGKTGGEQPIRLSSNCFATGSDRECIGSPVHEMLHALGIQHEQTRTDRDDYVIIQYNNIQEDRKTEFEKVNSADYSTYNVSYDYKSVMHYNSRAFIKPELDDTDAVTILAKQNSAESKDMGQRRGLSDLDIKTINKMYESQCKQRRRLRPFNFRTLG